MKQPLKSSKWQPWKRSFLVPSMFQMPETVQTGTERHLRAQRIGGCWSTGWWLDYSRWWAYLWHFHQPVRFAWYWPIADMVSQPLDIYDGLNMLHLSQRPCDLLWHFMLVALGTFKWAVLVSYKWNEALALCQPSRFSVWKSFGWCKGCDGQVIWKWTKEFQKRETCRFRRYFMPKCLCFSPAVWLEELYDSVPSFCRQVDKSELLLKKIVHLPPATHAPGHAYNSLRSTPRR